MDDNEIEIAVNEANNMPSFEIPGMPGANVGMINIGEMLGKGMGNKAKKKKIRGSRNPTDPSFFSSKCRPKPFFCYFSNLK